MLPRIFSKSYLYPLTTLVLFGLLAAACAPAAPPTPTPAPVAQPTAPPAKPGPAPAVATAAPKPAPTAAAKPAAPGKVSIRTAFKFSANYLPFWVALEKGFYREAGLTDVEVLEGTGSGTAAKTVGAGADTFGGSIEIATTMNAVAEGVPLKIVATILQRTPIALAYYRDAGIKTPKDLKGKTIIVAQGSAEARLVPAFLKRNGVNPADVTLVEVSSATKFTLFKARKGDAVSGFLTGDVLVYKDPGVGTMVLGDYGVDFPGSGIITSDAMIKERPEVVRAAIKASLKGFQFAIDQPAEAVAIGVKYFPVVKKDDLADPLTEVGKFIQSDDTKKFGLGHINKNRLAEAQDLLLDIGIMQKKVADVNSFFDDRFLK